MPTRRSRLPALLAAMAVAAGCAARDPDVFVASGEYVASIRVQGNGGLFAVDRDAALRDAMEQEAAASPFRAPLYGAFGLGRPPPLLDEGTLRRDAWRVETWYAHHGWFDARVQGWDLARRPTADPDRGLVPVRVFGSVERGPRSTIRTLAFDGLPGGPVGRALRRDVALREGEPFVLEDYTASLDALRGGLQDRGFAHARVEGRVTAYPEEEAVDVALTVEPGAFARFGDVRVVGNVKVPSRLLERVITIEEGAIYRISTLAETRAKLFGLGVFSLVDVVPRLDPERPEVVPVTIEVREAPFRSLQAGPGLEFDGERQALWLSAEYRDNHALRRLWRWTQRAELGAATLVDPTQEASVADQAGATLAPIATLSEKLEMPRLLGGDWGIGLEGTVELGVEPGYRFFRPEAVAQVAFEGFEHTALTAGYRVRAYDYYGGLLPDFEDSGLAIAEVEADPFFLTMLEQGVVHDRRNDPLRTTRGAYASLQLAEAGGPLPGDFGFFRTVAELRGYRPVILGGTDIDLTVAGRVGGGVILPYEPGGAVPVAERLFLGGGTSVRGFGARMLGPTERTGGTASLRDWTDEDPPAGDQEGGLRTVAWEYVPLGGNAQASGSLELRKYRILPFAPDLGVVAFTDVGQVWAGPGGATFDTLEWVVGGGLRYLSPIGPVRLDVGVRLTRRDIDDPFAVSSIAPYAFHLGIGEAF